MISGPTSKEEIEEKEYTKLGGKKATWESFGKIKKHPKYDKGDISSLEHSAWELSSYLEKGKIKSDPYLTSSVKKYSK